ncbi:MAG: hypothetical protein QXK37_06365 [Candidatus Woesearchaeota archaeon]
MESLELIVYIIIAVVAAGLILGVMKTVDYISYYKSNVEALSENKGMEYKATNETFAIELAKRWEECRFGLDNRSFSVYVSGNSTITYSFVVNELLRIDKCDAIDCYNKSNKLFVSEIKTPKIINIQCLNDSLIIT